MFELRFDTDNAAFGGMGETLEIERILTDIAKRVGMGYTQGTVRDSNGNSIGEYKWDEQDEYEDPRISQAEDRMAYSDPDAADRAADRYEKGMYNG